MRHFFIISIVVFSGVLLSCSGDDLAGDRQDKSEAMGVPIAFDNYVGRSITRGSAISSVDELKGQGFGLFAMYTNGTRYSQESGQTSDFCPAFMDNVKVTGTGDNTDIKWEYSPLRYWPSSKAEYVSFMAYAPYNADIHLVNSSGKEEGDRTFIQYQMNKSSEENSEAKVSDTRDLLYNCNNALNQQLYLNDEGTEFVKTENSNFTDDYCQKMSFKHATARIGFKITSSALKSKEDGLKSNAEITVNKFMLLGDNSTISEPHGAFYRSGLLNLNPNASNRWEVVSDEKVYFVFDKPDEYLFIIPYRMEDDPQTLRCYIDCDITYTAADGEVKSENYNSYGELNNDFKAGNAYRIIIDIGGKDKNVDFSIDKDDDWDGSSTIDITLKVKKKYSSIQL